MVPALLVDGRFKGEKNKGTEREREWNKTGDPTGRGLGKRGSEGELVSH